MNNFCSATSTSLFCNNDIKILTNGKDTKDVMWYITSYATKKQSKNNNVSALMADALLYYEPHSEHISSLLEQNQLLIFRCQQAINREMELSGPQVVSYIIGEGDCIPTHQYAPLYFVQRLLENTLGDLTGSEIVTTTQSESVSANNDVENEHEPELHANTETVTLEIGTKGHLQTRASQLDDYRFRGNELENLSYLEFVINTYEECIPVEMRDPEQYEQNPPQAEETRSSILGGRPPQQRSRYLLEHPRSKLYAWVIRPPGHNTLLKIVGPFFPSSKDPDRRIFYCVYCASMLALLVPWREIGDIISIGSTWEAALNEFLCFATPM
ncbi:hypothetical protein JVU11DRAFT_9174 [Chiua virens]|nr:hypothetical protein JVU11DRAFT_9174 [Chiua virens]